MTSLPKDRSRGEITLQDTGYSHTAGRQACHNSASQKMIACCKGQINGGGGRAGVQ